MGFAIFSIQKNQFQQYIIYLLEINKENRIARLINKKMKTWWVLVFLWQTGSQTILKLIKNSKGWKIKLKFETHEKQEISSWIISK